MYLVQEQMCPSVDVMILHQVVQAVAVEPDMVQRGIQDLAVIGESLPDMLLQQRGLSHALWALDPDDPGFPIDSVVNLALEIQAYLRDQSM